MSSRIDHLYVHVPFCAHRCGYCDFVTVTGNEHLQARYVGALLAEMPAFESPLATVFIGGGTPTLLDDVQLARLLAGLPSAGEITIECNPETVTPAKAQVLVEGGVTRVSVGAQSFNATHLKTLERLAQPGTVRLAVRRLRAAGISNLNLDLMFGVPFRRDQGKLANGRLLCNRRYDRPKRTPEVAGSDAVGARVLAANVLVVSIQSPTSPV